MLFEHITSADATDMGRRRKRNEDSLLRLPEHGIFCVADGMGGAFGGDIASRTAVDSLRKSAEEFAGTHPALPFTLLKKSVRTAVNEASRWIRNHADQMGVTGTGTTIAVLAFNAARPKEAVILHAGDSRVYRFRNQELAQLSNDHSVAAAAGIRNEKSLPAMFRGVITRAVGLDATVELEETGVDVRAGDLFLLCSDGLSKMVADKNILRIVRTNHPHGDLGRMAAELIAEANRAGGDDNITVVLVQVADPLPTDRPEPPAEEPAAEATPQTNTPPSSTPGNLSGTTPDVEEETPTPVTSELARTAGTQGAAKTVSTSAPVSGASAPEKQAGPPAWAWGVAGLVLLVAVAAGWWMWKDRSVSSTTEAASTAFGVAASGVSVPATVAQADEATAQTLDRLSSEVRATLATGRWGDLASVINRQSAAIRDQVKLLDSWGVFESWSVEWKRAEQGDLAGRWNQYAQAYADASGECVVTGSRQAPAWTGNRAADADRFCSALYEAQTKLLDQLETCAMETEAEYSTIATSLLVSLERVLYPALPSDGLTDAVASVRDRAGLLRGWVHDAREASLPLAPEELKRGPAEIQKSLSAEKDEVHGLFLAAICGADIESMAAESTEPQTAYVLQLQRFLQGARETYGGDMRSFRKGRDGRQVFRFIRLLNDTFPVGG